MKPRFNFIYNNDENTGFGKGYYVFFEGHDKTIKFDSYYPTWEQSKDVDGVSVGILNKFEHMYYLGYRMDMGLAVNLKDLF